MSLTKENFIITCNFPSDERFGITSQINRCSISIASNIAEGAGRESDKEFNYINKEQTLLLTEKVCKVQRMLNGLKKSVIQHS